MPPPPELDLAVPLRRQVSSALGAASLVLVSALFCLLPRAAAHFVGRHLGGLAYFISTRSRRTAIENLRLRLGADKRAARRIARISMGQAGAAIVDLLRAPRLTRRVVARDLEVSPETRALIEGLRGKPAVIAGCHYGNWEFMSLCRPLVTGAASLIVVRPPRYPHVARLFAALRGWTGQKVAHRAGAILRAHAHLCDGGSVAMVFDVSVPPQAGAVTVDFFGAPTYTTLAPGYLAARTGVPLLFCYGEPLGWHRYQLVLRRIDVPACDAPRETALALTKKLSSELEATIRAHPEHWAWWLKRWNIRPEGASGAWPSYSMHESRLLPGGRLPKDA
jgi:KDO2-lipid IV(A) lauroyltransferase